MDSSRIGSQLSIHVKRGTSMRARALLGLGTFLFACGTDNADPMPSNGSTTSAPPSSTTAESSGTAPSGDGASSATPGTGEAAPPGLGETANPGMGTELVGVDGTG